VTPSLLGEKMQVVGGRPAVCREGEAASRRPVLCSIYCPFVEPTGRRAEQGEGSRALPAPGDLLGATVPGAGGMVGQPWVFGDGRGAPAGRAEPGAVGPAWWACVALCEQWCRRNPCWGRSHPPGPNLSPVLFLFCSKHLTNSLGFSWCFFVTAAIILSLFPISPPSPLLPLACRSPLPCCLGSPVPLNLQPDPARVQVAPKVLWLTGCPAWFKFKASRLRMGGPSTESLPRRSCGQGLAAGALPAGVRLWGGGCGGCTPSRRGSALAQPPGPGGRQGAGRGLLASH